MLILSNATVVTGDGKTVIDGGTVVVDGGRIAEVRERSVAGGPKDSVMDLRGRLLVPGSINPHTHGVGVGPRFASGAPGVSRENALSNLDIHLRAGTTTVLNLDGFGLPDETESVALQHPINVQFCTTHFPLAFEAANQADGSGLLREHKAVSVQQMLERGAVCVGEVGAGHTLAGGGQDYMYIPNAVEKETGIRPEVEHAKAIKYAVLGRRVQVDAYDRAAVEAALAQAGLAGRITAERTRELIHQTVLPSFEKALEGLIESGRLAVKYGVPTTVHTSAPSEEACYELADIAGPLMVAAHTNHPTFTVEESIAAARRLREKGAVIEVCTLDAFILKKHVPTPAHMYALLKLDLVDTVGTDYAGGDWESAYIGLGYAVAEGATTLPKAVAMATRNVTRVFPKLAPERGEIAPGMIADLAVCDGRLDRCDLVFVNGVLVCEKGEIKR